uniref:Uncharacterized protein n=1 Tax=Chromera velia CCMP2878 TaxID=1169474 RepID=A0A0G4IBB9_9ALVE|eukprot:Cvel_12698.t1-p1 / transcript=Cvel_12698.t1 / gene=Cvel_12698 / organism=Chromera_velia_CCMP2878 / gene_product=hypothetical protein / transcript_product=hypothetical protein / location=Cvel_scaffold841:20818-30920(-) / protein_length=1236 / sequence_SO=supercontig / SO=protein_coding / is_pseudo=false
MLQDLKARAATSEEEGETKGAMAKLLREVLTHWDSAAPGDSAHLLHRISLLSSSASSGSSSREREGGGSGNRARDAQQKRISESTHLPPDISLPPGLVASLVGDVLAALSPSSSPSSLGPGVASMTEGKKKKPKETEVGGAVSDSVEGLVEATLEAEGFSVSARSCVMALSALVRLGLVEYDKKANVATSRGLKQNHKAFNILLKEALRKIEEDKAEAQDVASLLRSLGMLGYHGPKQLWPRLSEVVSRFCLIPSEDGGEGDGEGEGGEVGRDAEESENRLWLGGSHFDDQQIASVLFGFRSVNFQKRRPLLLLMHTLAMIWKKERLPPEGPDTQTFCLVFQQICQLHAWNRPARELFRQHLLGVAARPSISFVQLQTLASALARGGRGADGQQRNEEWDGEGLASDFLRLLERRLSQCCLSCKGGGQSEERERLGSRRAGTERPRPVVALNFLMAIAKLPDEATATLDQSTLNFLTSLAVEGVRFSELGLKDGWLLLDTTWSLFLSRALRERGNPRESSEATQISSAVQESWQSREDQQSEVAEVRTGRPLFSTEEEEDGQIYPRLTGPGKARDSVKASSEEEKEEGKSARGNFQEVARALVEQLTQRKEVKNKNGPPISPLVVGSLSRALNEALERGECSRMEALVLLDGLCEEAGRQIQSFPASSLILFLDSVSKAVEWSESHHERGTGTGTGGGSEGDVKKRGSSAAVRWLFSVALPSLTRLTVRGRLVRESVDLVVEAFERASLGSLTDPLREAVRAAEEGKKASEEGTAEKLRPSSDQREAMKSQGLSCQKERGRRREVENKRKGNDNEGERKKKGVHDAGDERKARRLIDHHHVTMSGLPADPIQQLSLLKEGVQEVEETLQQESADKEAEEGEGPLDYFDHASSEASSDLEVPATHFHYEQCKANSVQRRHMKERGSRAILSASRSPDGHSESTPSNSPPEQPQSNSRWIPPESLLRQRQQQNWQQRQREGQKQKEAPMYSSDVFPKEDPSSRADRKSQIHRPTEKSTHGRTPVITKFLEESGRTATTLLRREYERKFLEDSSLVQAHGHSSSSACQQSDQVDEEIPQEGKEEEDVGGTQGYEGGKTAGEEYASSPPSLTELRSIRMLSFHILSEAQKFSEAFQEVSLSSLSKKLGADSDRISLSSFLTTVKESEQEAGDDETIWEDKSAEGSEKRCIGGGQGGVFSSSSAQEGREWMRKETKAAFSSLSAFVLKSFPSANAITESGR